MPLFAASEAPPRPESMKFPVFSLLAGNFGIFRDEFAADSPLHRRVGCEPDVVVADLAAWGLQIAFRRFGPSSTLRWTSGRSGFQRSRGGH
jgi:hypothetical protein